MSSLLPGPVLGEKPPKRTGQPPQGLVNSRDTQKEKAPEEARGQAWLRGPLPPQDSGRVHRPGLPGPPFFRKPTEECQSHCIQPPFWTRENPSLQARGTLASCLLPLGKRAAQRTRGATPGFPLLLTGHAILLPNCALVILFLNLNPDPREAL